MAMRVRGGSYRYYLRAKGVYAEPDSSLQSNSTENSSCQGNRGRVEVNRESSDRSVIYDNSNYNLRSKVDPSLFGTESSHGEFSDKPSYSEDGDVCNVSESSGHKYASLALAKFNVNKKNSYEFGDLPRKSYDFVEVGHISAGYFRGRRIFHFNFKAMDKDDSSADVETFFSEVTLQQQHCPSASMAPHRNGGKGGSDVRNLPPVLQTQKGCFRMTQMKIVSKIASKIASSNYYFTGIRSAASLVSHFTLFHHISQQKNRESLAPLEMRKVSEVTLNKHNSVSVDNVYPLAPSHSLPEEANTCGCMYCLSRNIHHPQFRDGFRTGRGHHLKYMVSKIASIDKYIKKGKRKRKFLPKFSDPRFYCKSSLAQV